MKFKDLEIGRKFGTKFGDYEKVALGWDLFGPYNAVPINRSGEGVFDNLNSYFPDDREVTVYS